MFKLINTRYFLRYDGGVFLLKVLQLRSILKLAVCFSMDLCSKFSVKDVRNDCASLLGLGACVRQERRENTSPRCIPRTNTLEFNEQTRCI